MERASQIDPFPRQGIPIAPDGTYRVRDLTPGEYWIQVQKASPGSGYTSSARTFTVQNRDLSEVNLVAGVDRRITGRVVLDSPPANLDGNKLKLGVALEEASDEPKKMAVGPDLSFEIGGLSSVTYSVRLLGAFDGYLRSVRIGGVDAPRPEIEVGEDSSVIPVETAAAFDGATLSGTVKPAEPRNEVTPMVGVSILLLPQENQSPYLIERREPVELGGAFTISGVAPGSYTVLALPAKNAPELGDPEVRRRLQSYGKSVELGRGKKVTVELTLTPHAEQ